MNENEVTGVATVNRIPIPFAADSNSQDVAALLAAAVKAISDEGAKTAGRDRPLFFPDGIELILLQFKIGDKVNITLKISGKECCKDPVPPARLDAPVTVDAA